MLAKTAIWLDCGSGLARDWSGSVCQADRGAAIAGKPRSHNVIIRTHTVTPALGLYG